MKDKKSKDNLIFIDYLNNTKPSNNCSNPRSLLNLLGITSLKLIWISRSQLKWNFFHLGKKLTFKKVGL